MQWMKAAGINLFSLSLVWSCCCCQPHKTLLALIEEYCHFKMSAPDGRYLVEKTCCQSLVRAEDTAPWQFEPLEWPPAHVGLSVGEVGVGWLDCGHGWLASVSSPGVLTGGHVWCRGQDTAHWHGVCGVWGAGVGVTVPAPPRTVSMVSVVMMSHSGAVSAAPAAHVSSLRLCPSPSPTWLSATTLSPPTWCWGCGHWPRIIIFIPTLNIFRSSTDLLDRYHSGSSSRHNELVTRVWADMGRHWT